MNQRDIILASFNADLDRAATLLDLTRKFKAFADSQGPQLDERWEAAEALHGLSSQVRSDLPILSGSLLLYVCGRFEAFAKELVVDLAEDMADSASSYKDLSQKFRGELRSRTLEVAQSPGKYGYTEQDADNLLTQLLANISSMSPTTNAKAEAEPDPEPEPSTGVLIAPDILALTDANMRPDILADIFKRVEITDLWKNMGKQTGLKIYQKTPDDGLCSVEAQRRLTSLMKERNAIAHHQTQSTNFPDPDKVLLEIAHLRKLGEALVGTITLSVMTRYSK